MNQITISATEEGVVTTLVYEGKEYTQTLVPTDTGGSYAGCRFSDEEAIPEEIAEALEDLRSYSLMKALIDN